MDGSYPTKLRLWESPGMALAPDESGVSFSSSPGVCARQADPEQSDFAERLFASEALNPPPTAARLVEPAEPYTLQWFLNIESQRHGRQGRWIPRLLEFAKHSGETLLGLGHGLGTDWIQYARHGASVVVCSPSASELALIRRNFELRSLPGRFIHAAPHCLPLESASIDVACISSFLAADNKAEKKGSDPLDLGGQTPFSPPALDNAPAVVDEVYRVLKPGGKVLALAPAKYDVDFWLRAARFWQSRPGGSLDRQGIPHYSVRRLRRLFTRFVEHRVRKRQLRRSEIPHVWRWLPLPLLERLMGHVLVLRAFKPLSAAIPFQAAA
jgi:SAM-dependent methyltransferase